MSNQLLPAKDRLDKLEQQMQLVISMSTDVNNIKQSVGQIGQIGTMYNDIQLLKTQLQQHTDLGNRRFIAIAKAVENDLVNIK